MVYKKKIKHGATLIFLLKIKIKINKKNLIINQKSVLKLYMKKNLKFYKKKKIY